MATLASMTEAVAGATEALAPVVVGIRLVIDVTMLASVYVHSILFSALNVLPGGNYL